MLSFPKLGHIKIAEPEVRTIADTAGSSFSGALIVSTPVCVGLDLFQVLTLYTEQNPKIPGPFHSYLGEMQSNSLPVVSVYSCTLILLEGAGCLNTFADSTFLCVHDQTKGQHAPNIQAIV